MLLILVVVGDDLELLVALVGAGLGPRQRPAFLAAATPLVLDLLAAALLLRVGEEGPPPEGQGQEASPRQEMPAAGAGQGRRRPALQGVQDRHLLRPGSGASPRLSDPRRQVGGGA